jgi:hypothetical protein
LPARPIFIRINAHTRADRKETISLASEAINSSGGWVIDSRLFSNVSINFNFEIELKNAERLYRVLKEIDIRLTEKSRAALEELTQMASKAYAQAGDVAGTLQITFIHNEPALRIEIPPIPG